MTVKVDGLDELVRDLEKAGVGIADLKAGFAAIAEEARTLATGFAPRRSGRLVRSIRATSAKNYASVSAGGPSAPYAAPQNYGWSKHHITGVGFMQRADMAIRPRVLIDLVSAVDRRLSERDLS